MLDMAAKERGSKGWRTRICADGRGYYEISMEVRDMALVRGRKALLDSGERGDDQEDEIRGNDFVKSLEEVCVLPPSMRKLAT